MSIINHNASSVNSVHPLHDFEQDGPAIKFDQGPFPDTYLYGIDEGSIPLDPDVYQSLFDSTPEDRADYRRLFDDDLDDESSEVCEPVASLVDALEAIASHYDGIDCEVAVLVAQALREKAAEGIALGRPADLGTWEDREAVARGWAG